MNVLPLSKYDYSFPDPHFAPKEGLLAYGGDLNPTRLIKGYLEGIFPWYNENDPILWWSPDPRFILNIDEFKISKSLQKTVNKDIYEVKFDTNFRAVIESCAKVKRKDSDHTWIQSELIEAYCELHKQGYAHSFESYLDGKLVGGGYGISLGGMFCGESMFTLKTDASKVAFVKLVEKLKSWEFDFIDAQIPTDHLRSFGAKEMSREVFLNSLKLTLNKKTYLEKWS